FKFKNLGGRPVPSLLRRFSAPVKLDYTPSHPELIFQLAHDDDLFNRWEAGQMLAQQVIQGQVDSGQFDGGQPDQPIDDQVLDAFGAVLADPQLDPAMIAQIFTLPGEAILAEQQHEINPEAIYLARKNLRSALANRHKLALRERYQSMQSSQAYQFAPHQNAARALKNCCLAYLLDQPEEQDVELAMAQFQTADNMTDSIAALAALIH
ncbi:MAG: aminopeptidase N C-terminal domain-containing protein, partial [Gammaproteobacteria bacterium]